MAKVDSDKDEVNPTPFAFPAGDGGVDGGGFVSQGRVRGRGSGNRKLWRGGKLQVWGRGIDGFVPLTVTTEARRRGGD